MKARYEFDGSVTRASREGTIQTPNGVVLVRIGDDLLLAPDGSVAAVVPSTLGGERVVEKPKAEKPKEGVALHPNEKSKASE